MSEYPESYRYTKDHEWVSLEKDIATMGITDYAQDELGDIVYVELPEMSTELTANDTFGVIESVKAVSDLFAPMSGEVVEINESLEEEPELVNEDPHGDGWMIKVKISDITEFDSLMTSEEYEEYIAEEQESGLDEDDEETSDDLEDEE